MQKFFLAITFPGIYFTGEIETRWLISNQLIKRGEGPILSFSSKQNVIVLSSTEAEYITAIGKDS